MTNLFSLEGKVALVTGGSSGIGIMIARGFVQAGARVYIASRKRDALEAVAKELSELGTCDVLPADLSTVEGARGLAAELSQREKALHVLVNNAGANWAAPIDEYPESGWDKVVDVNLKAVFFLTQSLLPILRAAASDGDPARIINVASIDGLHVPGFETYAYAASKAGLVHLTRALAKRLARERITANAICPGPFESKMMRATIERFRDNIVAGTPLGRIGHPDDMAGVATFLASRAGSYVTGAAIPVDGGISTTV